MIKMGMYTAFVVDCVLENEYVPVINSLYSYFGKLDGEPLTRQNEWLLVAGEYDLPFIREWVQKTDRSTMIPFGSGDMEFPRFEREGLRGNRWSFTCSFKNYDSEIELFVERVLPRVARVIYYCASQYCEDEKETIHYLNWNVTAGELEELERKREEKMEFYRVHFGLEPTEKRDIGNDVCVYEREYPLVNDVHLPGLMLVPMVNFNKKTRRNSKSRVLVMSRDKMGGVIECIHTIIHGASIDPVDQGFQKPIELSPIELLPEDHFIALCSWVQSIVELGLLNCLVGAHEYGVDRIQFGFNVQMQHQVMRCIKQFNLDMYENLVKRVILEIIENSTVEWREKRWDLLNETYGNLYECAKKDLDFYKILYDGFPSKQCHGELIKYDVEPSYIVSNGQNLSLCFFKFDDNYDFLEGKGLQGSGYTWEAIVESLVRRKAPEIAGDLLYDTERGMFRVVSSSLDSLLGVAELIKAANSNQEILEEALEHADSDLLK
jgi:hypothetical protein